VWEKKYFANEIYDVESSKIVLMVDLFSSEKHVHPRNIFSWDYGMAHRKDLKLDPIIGLFVLQWEEKRRGSSNS